MNIVILHRIPFARFRYDLAVDHQKHTVRYLCLTGDPGGLPAGAEWRVVEAGAGDARSLAERHADWLSAADHLIARSEYDLLTAADLRERFRIPGDVQSDVLPVRDKWLMRTLARQAGIPQPSFWSNQEFRRNPPATGTYLVKPRLEASSTGIQLGTPTQILAQPAVRDDVDGYFVEEFVPGEVWHVDGYLRDGEFGAVVCSTYVGDCLKFAHGSPLGSGQVPDDPALLSMLRDTLTALGQKNGSFHYEAIRTQAGKFVFLETASRVGGAGVADAFALRTGIDLYQADLKYQLTGSVPTDGPQLSARYYGWFVYPAHHRTQGMDVDFDPARYAGRLSSFTHNARPKAHAGQISYAAGATPLSGVVQGSTASEVRETLREIFATTAVVETR
ncbi:acetyl-CoA carboxylase biotin carboxylase subunit family protein [Streptomyces sp. UNOC14_S4]|uniref:ATP-grasp domain-containing protein n=1 Tax=Streptomyces sp. UNOC14_S4 TaxID=2872340 RepID=UPI001E3EF866|nr:hypothetical protein [Streptomyces sp. UNOC14_S4]MCC3767316.1 hypothetical protein [Streptomyces sp. UNOC14_S4]